MKTKLLSGVVALGLTACGGGVSPDDRVVPTAVEARITAQALPTSQTEVVVMLRSDVTVQEVSTRYGATVVDRFGQRPIYRLSFPTVVATSNALSQMQRDPTIRFAERNYESQAPEARQQLVWAVGGSEQVYGSQWVPEAIALRQAHALSTGSGVRVAVLDTGIDLTHPALAPRLAQAPGGGVLGYDFVDFDADPSEVGRTGDLGFGHGTHVAGLVALTAPNATLMPVRVLDQAGRGNAWVLAEALMWAIDPDGNPATDDGARVINLSLGTVRPTRLLDIAIELATCSDDDDNDGGIDYSDPGFAKDVERCNQLHGAVVMAAAGNSGSATERQYPAAEAAEGQLAITASTANQTLAAFSNSGPWVQLAAPGYRVVSTVPGGGYGTWSGTSMATPIATGVAALVLARNPDWKPVDVTKRLLDRSARLCDRTTLRALHAFGAVADFVPADPICR